VDYRI